jgi:pimeloyl-ACP methyl ester carboxylesterase
MLLHYKKTGSGPVVVLLHGYLSSLSYWRDVTTDLSKNYTVVTLDLLGFGASPKPHTSTYTIEEQVAAIHETLAQSGVQRFQLVGHSMGAVIAARYSTTYPVQVVQQLLYMPPIFTSAQQAEKEIKSTNTLYRVGLYSPLSRLLWPVAKLVAARSARHAGKARSHIIHGLSSNTHRSRTLSRINIIERASLLEILQKTTIPTHLFVGIYDRAIYRKNLTNFPLKSVKIATTHVDGGHHFPVKNPSHIREYLV